jgi:hypothetical protein
MFGQASVVAGDSDRLARPDRWRRTYFVTDSTDWNSARILQRKSIAMGREKCDTFGNSAQQPV